MSTETNPDAAGEMPQSLSAAAEEKRKAARRRFLLRSTAAGSGVLITTLCHQRAVAAVRNVSTMEACTSMHGSIVLKNNGTADMVNSSVGGSTKYYQCTIG